MLKRRLFRTVYEYDNWHLGRTDFTVCVASTHLGNSVYNAYHDMIRVKVKFKILGAARIV